MTDCSEYTIQPALVINPGETRRIAPNFLRKCAVYWLPDEPISFGEFNRPRIGNGLAAQCSVAGTTGQKEPLWPKAVGGIATDGSVTWTMVAAGTNGLNAISGPSVTSDISGVTCSNVSVLESSKILLDVSAGAIAEQEGELVFSFTLDGVSRIARQKIIVKKV